MQCFSGPWPTRSTPASSTSSPWGQGRGHPCTPCNSCWIKPKLSQKEIMLVLLSLLRVWAISRDACAAAVRESLICRCHKQSTRISFRAVITSQVPPVAPCQCDPRADSRLMTPNHHQTTPIIQPSTSWPKTEFLLSANILPSQSIYTLPSPRSCIQRVQNLLHEFKWAALWKSTALIPQAELEPLSLVRAGKGSQSS